MACARSFEVRPAAEGHGRGLFATALIRKGDVVVYDAPAWAARAS